MNKIEQAIELIRPYYRLKPLGGSLHICLDDGNMENDHVDFCLNWARQNADSMGEAIALFLQSMSADERDELYCRYGEYSK